MIEVVNVTRDEYSVTVEFYKADEDSRWWVTGAVEDLGHFEVGMWEPQADGVFRRILNWFRS